MEWAIQAQVSRIDGKLNRGRPPLITVSNREVIARPMASCVALHVRRLDSIRLATRVDMCL